MSLEWRGAAVTPGPSEPVPSAWQSVDLPGRPATFAGADAVAYRTTFEDPRGEGEPHAVLVLEGVYAHARVWLNGEQVAEHDAYFEPLRVQLDVEDENELVVECRRPEDRFGGIFASDAVDDALGVPGIWWDARVETHPDPYVAALDVAPRVDGDAAELAVSARVHTDERLEDRLTISVRPEGDARGGGTMDRAPVSTDPGTAVVEETVAVRDPSLWWPHDRGAQPRYVVRAKVEDAERTATTGLRSVSYADDGFQVNGEAVPARGLTVVDPTTADVERAVEANANLLRAKGAVLSPAVYAACDEAGVLIWQDLPLVGPGEFETDRGRALAERLVAARSNHPSLAALSVHGDPVPDFAEGLGSGRLDRLRYRWRAWRTTYNREPAERIADTVDEVPTFPVVGPAGIDPDALASYPGWQFGEARDVEWLCDHYDLGDVVAAFGASAPAADAGGSPQTAGRTRADGGADPRGEQADVVGRIADVLRRRGAHAIVVDGLRDVGPDGLGLLAEDGSPRPAFDRLAATFEPVRAVLASPEPGESDVVVCNDRPAGQSLTVEWDHDGEREQRELTVGPNGRAVAGSVELGAGDEVTIAVAEGDSVVKNTYSI